MLLQFKFSNFMSFRDEAILDMRKSRITEYPHHIVDCGMDKVLKTSVIYGANASGKTNVYRALQMMREYVLQSFSFGGKNPSTLKNLSLLLGADSAFVCIPFLFDQDSPRNEVRFEIYIYVSDKKTCYNYGFSLNPNDNSVEKEWLNCKTKTQRKYREVFTRTNDLHLEFSPRYFTDDQQRLLQTSLQRETLLVSLGTLLKIDICENVHHWFSELTLLDFGTPMECERIRLRAPEKLLQNDETEVASILQYMTTFDRAIKGFNSKKIDVPSSIPQYAIYVKHQKNGTQDLVDIPLNLESAGTQKMFSLYYPIQKVLKNGGVLFVDEMNDRLHPLLQRNIVLTFLDPARNPKNAQLIFTTHDVTLLAVNLFRRDEIWIVEKNENTGGSELYSITDFKNEENHVVRKDDCLWKRYLLGEYGGIPHLEKILIPGLEVTDDN